MKKLAGIVLSIAALFLALWILPVALNFTSWLYILDSTDFGFPWWLDLLIDSIAGGIATTITIMICAALNAKDKKSKDTVGIIVGIIIGFVVAVVAHIFMRYWYVIVSLIVMAIIGIVVRIVVQNKKEKHIESNTIEGE